MRVGFGQGVSIPSQLRYVAYVDRWTNSMNKQYIERPVEIVEIHIHGLRDGVKVSVEGYVENGRRMEIFHTFNRREKTIIDQAPANDPENGSRKLVRQTFASSKDSEKEVLVSPADGTPSQSFHNLTGTFAGTVQTVILKPTHPIISPTSDINIDFERRSQASAYTGFAMITSIAHVWFNAYFEGGHEGETGGVFEIEWEAMDGIKGSERKGTKALDSLKVVWRYARHEKPKVPVSTGTTEQQADGALLGEVITEPVPGEAIQEGEPADWRGESDPEAPIDHSKSGGVDSGRPGASLLTMGTMIKAGAGSMSKELGLRKSDPASANVSRAASRERGGEHGHESASPPTLYLPRRVTKEEEDITDSGDEDYQGVRAHGPEGEEHVAVVSDGHHPDDSPLLPDSETKRRELDQVVEVEGRQDTKAGKNMELGMAKLANMVAKMKGKEKAENAGWKS